MDTRKRIVILSVMLCVMLAAIVFIAPASRAPVAPYSFDIAAGMDLNEARSAYKATSANAELYAYILCLCRQHYLGGNLSNELVSLGGELYARAKAKTLDLETIGDTRDTSAVIELLNDLGVTP